MCAICMFHCILRVCFTTQGLPHAAVLESLTESSQHPSENTPAYERLLLSSVLARTKGITSQGDRDRAFASVVDTLCSDPHTLQDKKLTLVDSVNIICGRRGMDLSLHQI